MYQSIHFTGTTSFRSRPSQVTRRKKLHTLIAGFQPAAPILAWRIAIPLFLLTAGLLLVQPCAGQGGTWITTGSLNIARNYPTATLLPNGKVLVAGGDNGNSLASAELYDPASGTWTATGSLATGRSGHTASLLPDGEVLVAGGFNNFIGSLSSAELYDPASGTFTETGSLAAARTFHTGTLLPNGKVLVAGAVSYKQLRAH
jgi:hypothetical protein